MTVGRIKSFPYPERIDSTESVEMYLKSLYRSLTEDQVERLTDFENMDIDSLVVSDFDISTSFNPTADATVDLGAVGTTDYRFRHLYLSGNLSDETNTLTVANAKDAYDKRVDTWGDGLEYSSQTAAVDYNTTNLKITSTELDTIQGISSAASPTFAGLTLTGLSGVLKASAGVVAGSADHVDLGNIQGGTTAQYYHLNSSEHTEISGWLDNVTLGSSGALTIPTGQAFAVGSTTWTSGSTDNINADSIEDGSTNAIPTLTQETNWGAAYTNRVDTWTAPLAFSSNTASIPVATTSADGYLSQTDWDTFNNKSTLALGETSTTAYRGDRGKTAYDHVSANGASHSYIDQSVVVAATPQLAGLGLGVAPGSNTLHVKESAFAETALLERSGQTSDLHYASVRVLATKTTDMGDGFGSGLMYCIQDDGDTINPIAFTAGIRDGADNSGAFTIETYNAGSNTVKVTVDKAGLVTIADGGSINLQEDITFTGATTVNQIKFPDTLADALSFKEGANSYLTFKTTNGAEAVILGKNLIIPNAGYVGSTSDTDAIQIEADGDVVLTQDLAVTGTVAINSTVLTGVATNFITIGDLKIGWEARVNANAGTNDNLILNAKGTGIIYINIDDGTGGVSFCDGASGVVATIDSSGDLSCAALTATGTVTIPTTLTGVIRADSGVLSVEGTAVLDADFGSAGLCATNGSGTYSIVTDNSSNWDTAHGWGDHAGANSDITSMSGITGTIATPTNLTSKTTAAWNKSIGSGGDYVDWATMIADMPDLIAHAVTVTIKAGTTLTEICDIKNKHGVTSASVITVQAEKYFPTSGAIPTADSATATTLRDAALATAALGDDYFNGCWVFIVDGTGTDNGFVLITDYVDATGDVVVSSWTTQPDNTSRYIIVGALIDCQGTQDYGLDIRNNVCPLRFLGIGITGADADAMYIKANPDIIFYYSGFYDSDFASMEGYDSFVIFWYCGIVGNNTANHAVFGGILLGTKTSCFIYYCGISDNNQRGIIVTEGSYCLSWDNFGDANGTWGGYARLSAQMYFTGTECSGSSGNHSDEGTAGDNSDDQAAAYT